MIAFVPRADIDEKKWNDTVRQAVNTFPYAYSWYLDCVSPHWHALIMDDYEAVFPLVWRQRFGIHYLYQPMFTQQLGVFSRKAIDQHLMRQFLSAIPKKFRFIELNINYMNEWADDSFQLYRRTNLVLDIGLPYEQLSPHYSDNVKRNLQKARKNNLHISEDVTAQTVIEFFKANTGIKIPELGEYHYESLAALIRECQKRSMGCLAGVFDTHGNLFAAGFFIVDEKKIINLLPSTGEDGKEIGAGFLLVDQVIKKFSNRDKILDFEGSMIPSIARFYKSFGAKEQPYWRLRRNNLPWLIKWMKD